MSEDKQLIHIEILSQRGGRTLQGFSFNYLEPDIPTQKELMEAYELLDEILKKEGRVCSKKTQLSLGTQFKRTSPTYYAYDCLIKHHIETIPVRYRMNYSEERHKYLSIQLKHEISIAGKNEKLETVADMLSEKIRKSLLKNVQKLFERDFNTFEEDVYFNSIFRYDKRKRISFPAERVLSVYFQVSEMDEIKHLIK
ncbi:hypothetical protein DRJ25_04970 [Candidatus Woesearchaeota archaeon]|nr:MAG: hypothetical protein DRJ25_04970 [Candidatus Woesearchaeota archaeon]